MERAGALTCPSTIASIGFSAAFAAAVTRSDFERQGKRDRYASKPTPTPVGFS
jgi:hypothetical protein